MASPEQIAANRRNARRSTGPKDTDRTRFNGLKHGLRAEQVVLPGEDPAAFEAERQGWIDDWRPKTHTRAVLCERAAVAAWKLRRATRVEGARLYETAADVAHEFDTAQAERVGVALHRLPSDPAGATARLRSEAAGLDALAGLWDGLADALDAPAGWASRPEHHDRLLNLLGHPAGPDPEGLEVARASRKLQSAPDPEAAAALRTFCLGRAEELRQERAKYWDPQSYRRHLIDQAIAPLSKEAQLLHRYEMEHEKSLRAAIRQLVALEKSGADLAEPEVEPESVSNAVAEGSAKAIDAPATPKSSGSNHSYQITCDELASVGVTAASGPRPERSTGSPGRRGRPIGGDLGPSPASGRA